VDAILHVSRGFLHDDVPHLYGEPDPLRDIELIETELLLSDLELLRRAADRAGKRAKAQDAAAQKEAAVLGQWLACAEQGNLGALVQLASQEKMRLPAVDALQLLTTRPVLYLLNVGEKAAPRQVEWEAGLDKLARERRARWLRFNGSLEAELAALAPDERALFLQELGLSESGLAAVVREAYALLGLISFLTAGDKEVRAWPLRAGSTVAEAAGTIHSDMQRGFIKADVVGYDEFIACGTMAAVREQGRLRIEGRDYIVKDGDVLLIRFNV
jgi:GTP-binding protein YchF